MATRPVAGQRHRQASPREIGASPSLSQFLGLGAIRPNLSPDDFYAGLRPIVGGLKDGTLTEKQASLLIELLASAYAGAAVNRQIDNLFQNWTEHLTSAWLSEDDDGG